MRGARGRPPTGGERRQQRRWLDKRLVTVQALGDEYPGMTGDLSLTGMRIGLPRVTARVGGAMEVSIAFAQDVLTVNCRLVYVRERPWGALVGVRYAPGQEDFRRFLSRRYCQPEENETPQTPRVPFELTRRILRELVWSGQAQQETLLSNRGSSSESSPPRSWVLPRFSRLAAPASDAR